MSVPRIVTRNVPQAAFDLLSASGMHPILARIYAARGISGAQQLDTSFNGLAPFERLRNCVTMAQLLADAIAAKQRLLIVADYDADGATACALGMIALQSFGAQVEYLVPNRFEYGYGLTPEIVALAAARRPDFLITVDNGIASIDGVAAASELGIRVLITDHHLPAAQLPAAACIVNPNQPGCDFPSRNLAGVGVMFYVLLALRAELRARRWFGGRDEPNLADLLDLVALGTVADVVRLDDNNRIAIDTMTRDLRECNRVLSSSATDLQLEDYDGFTITYTFSPTLKTLTRTKAATSKTLLTGCEALSFSLGQRNTVAGTFDQFPASTPSQAKVVDVSWRCSRSILGVRANTEAVQTAKIVIRKQGT